MTNCFDPDELVRYAEMYGHPEEWIKKAQQLHTENEKLREQQGRACVGARFGEWVITALNYSDGSVTTGFERKERPA